MQLFTYKPRETRQTGLIMPHRTFTGHSRAVQSLLQSLRTNPVNQAQIRTKLPINEPGDRYEQEADRIADTVISMPAPQEQTQDKKKLVPSIVLETDMMRTGKKLPEPILQAFEERFGYCFDNVRIHTDEQAHQLSDSVGARAFAYGTDIVFNRGEFNPWQKDGQRMIAHELVHTIQQNNSETDTAGTPSQPLYIQATHNNYIQRNIRIPTVRPSECIGLTDARDLLRQALRVLESDTIGNADYIALLTSISELEAALQNFQDTCVASERPSPVVAPGGAVGLSISMSDRSGALAVIVALIAMLAAITTGAQLSGLDPEQQEHVRRQAEALEQAAERVRENIRNLRRQSTETLTDFFLEPTIEEATPEEIAEDVIPEDEPPDSDRCFVIPQGPRGGNAEHDALAAHITGEPVEYLVTSPSGRSWHFDGMDATNTLYEVKTRHDFIRVIEIIDSASQLSDRQIQAIAQWIPDLHDDIEEESIIAYECGYPFRVATNNRNILQALRVILNDVLPAEHIEWVPFSFSE